MSKRLGSAIILTLLLICMLTLAFNIQPVKTDPGTIIVPDDYPTIQEAINNANEGDTIYVRNGTYYENVVVNKAVSLVGENKETTIIDGNKAKRVVSVTANDVILEDLTVRNSLPWYSSSGCLYITSHNNMIRNNIVTNNGDKGMGIWFDSACNNTVIDNIIAGNYYGISLIGSTNNTVVQNNIMNNSGHGVYLSDSTSNIIFCNSVVNNWDGVRLKDSLLNNIENNTISQNDFGMYLHKSSNTNVTNNNIVNSAIGIVLQYCNDFTFKGNSISNNGYNLRVSAVQLSHYIHDIDVSNTVNEKPVYYWVNKQNKEVPSDAGYVGLVNCTRITVENLSLTNNYEGLLLAFTENSTVSNVNLTDNRVGIVLHYSGGNIVANNTIEAFKDQLGLFLLASTNCTLRNNIINGDGRGLGIGGEPLFHYIHNIDSSNAVHGKPIYYWVNKHNRQVPIDGGFVGLINCTNITVKDINTTINHCGILLAYSRNSSVTNVKTSGNTYGIILSFSINNTVNNSEITGNNHCGSYVWSSNNTLWKDNMIANNNLGILFLESSFNKIYHNNFVNNLYGNIEVYSALNVWDDGYPSGGNYWSNYNGTDFYGGPYQNLTGSDGIGDDPYIIDAHNQDDYPLMIPWGYPISYESNTTITDVDVTQSDLNFKTEGPVGTTAYINITLLSDFNNTVIRVFIDDVEIVPPPFPIITKNGTHYFIYVEFVQSTHNMTVRFYAKPWDLTGPTMWVSDGKCDIRDIALVAMLYGSVKGDGRYDLRADITGPTPLVPDGKIDIRDIALIAIHYGEIY